MDLKAKVFEIQNLINSNKIKEARSKCEKLVKNFSKNSFIINLYGLILQKSGQVSESIIQFKKAISCDVNNFAAMNNLANSYKIFFKYLEAEELYKKIIKENYGNVKALNNYANLKKELNKYQDAKNLLLDAIKIEPENINILSNIASCCQAIGDKDEAKQYALKILKLNKKNFSNHRFLSNITNYNNNSNHLKTMNELLSDKNFKNVSYPEKIDLYFALGKAYEDIGDFENSYNFLKTANYLKNKNVNIFKIDKLFNNIIKVFEEFRSKFFKRKTIVKTNNFYLWYAKIRNYLS